MATRSPFHGDYRIFVGAFPSGELAARIQALREHYDPKTARITPPHVTLAGTYWRSGPAPTENEAATIERLQAARGVIRTFDLRLGGIGAFPPRDNPVIFLKVTPTAGLLSARAVLLELLGQDKHRRFAPHLTLAMRLRGAVAAAILADLAHSEWESGRWSTRIDALRLMLRGPDDRAWQTIAELPLNA